MKQPTVVTLNGDYDISDVARLDEQLSTAAHSDVAIVDASGLGYIDSSGLGKLIRLKSKMLANGTAGIVRVRSASPHLLRLFQICGIDRLFEIEKPHDDTSG